MSGVQRWPRKLGCVTRRGETRDIEALLLAFLYLWGKAGSGSGTQTWGEGVKLWGRRLQLRLGKPFGHRLLSTDKLSSGSELPITESIPATVAPQLDRKVRKVFVIQLRSKKVLSSPESDFMFFLL